MTTWILILIVYKGGITQIEYKSIESCRAAAVSALEEKDRLGYQAFNAAVCVKKEI